MRAVRRRVQDARDAVVVRYLQLYSVSSRTVTHLRVTIIFFGREPHEREGRSELTKLVGGLTVRIVSEGGNMLRRLHPSRMPWIRRVGPYVVERQSSAEFSNLIMLITR